MSANAPPGSAPNRRVVIAASRLWAGGVATAIVAALVAIVGVLLCSSVLGIDLAAVVLPIFDSLAVNYGLTAAVLALAATGVAHLLALTTPRPRAFFAWIVGLVTLAGMVVPFASGAELDGKIAAALINLAIGIAIASLLSAVLSRTVSFAQGPW